MPRHDLNRHKAERWIERNPKAVALFERYALELMRTGKPFGINLIRERVRWEQYFRKDPQEQFKFCNTYSPYVARYLIAKHPELANFMTCNQTKEEKLAERA